LIDEHGGLMSFLGITALISQQVQPAHSLPAFEGAQVRLANPQFRRSAQRAHGGLKILPCSARNDAGALNLIDTKGMASGGGLPEQMVCLPE
jgi:hypothetical protein